MPPGSIGRVCLCAITLAQGHCPSHATACPPGLAVPCSPGLRRALGNGRAGRTSDRHNAPARSRTAPGRNQQDLMVAPAAMLRQAARLWARLRARQGAQQQARGRCASCVGRAHRWSKATATPAAERTAGSRVPGWPGRWNATTAAAPAAEIRPAPAAPARRRQDGPASGGSAQQCESSALHAVPLRRAISQTAGRSVSARLSIRDQKRITTLHLVGITKPYPTLRWG
jgi:hypothetical protein